MSLIYSKEAKIRITKLGSSTILEFLEKVPPRLMSDYLPRVDGFKKKSPREYKERLKRLVQMLTHSNSAEREWASLGMAWLCLGGINYKKLFNEDIRKVNFDSKSEIEFLNKFILSCEPEGCSSEEAIDLILFSGFPFSEAAADLVSKLPSRMFLEQKRSIHQLRLDVVSLRKIVESNSNISSEEWVRRIDFEKSMSSFTESTNSFQQKIESLSISISEQFSGINLSLDKLNPVPAQIEESICRLDANEKFFEEKIAGIIQRIQNVSSAAEPLAHTSAQENLKPFRIERQDSIQETARYLENINDTYKLLVENFTRVGVSKLDAVIISNIVASAVFSGQIVQFCGSLAETLADVTSCTLFSESYLIWNIPLGLCDSSISEDLISEVHRKSTDIHGVLLRGVNRSAFEVYGDYIKRFILDRQLGRGDSNNIPFIAIWVDGPTTLLDCRPLLELGPLIDTDKFTWGRPKWKSVAPGKFASPFPNKADKVGSSDMLEIESAIEGLNMPVTQLRKWIMIRALFWLFQITDNQNDQILISIVIGWILPWATANELEVSKFCSSFEAHMPDALNNQTVMKLLAYLQKY